MLANIQVVAFSVPKDDDPGSEVEFTTARVLLWILAVLIFIILLPVYIVIWTWRWATGRNVKARLWMFAGKRQNQATNPAASIRTRK